MLLRPQGDERFLIGWNAIKVDKVDFDLERADTRVGFHNGDWRHFCFMKKFIIVLSLLCKENDLLLFE